MFSDIKKEWIFWKSVIKSNYYLSYQNYYKLFQKTEQKGLLSEQTSLLNVQGRKSPGFEKAYMNCK